MKTITPITLVLLPGMDGTGRLFAPLLKELPNWVMPVVVSYPTDQPLDYKGHLEIVKTALPINEPFILLGESFSGPLALMASAGQPKGLRGVILCATFVTWPLFLPASIIGVLVSAGMFRIKIPHLFLRMLLGKSASEELKKLLSQSLTIVRPEVLKARAKSVFELDCTTALRECPVPILAIRSGNDSIVTSRSSELIRSIRPDADFVEIDGPHLILQREAREAALVIQKFVEAVKE